jgi:carbon monoxide dehydrogenase subunit G
MEFTNKFTVPAPLEQAWALLRDVERIAPCLPGASDVESIGDDTYTGAVVMKVGPIKIAYRGTVAFRDIDVAAKRLVLDASGKENTGKGSAAAIVTVQLKDAGGTSTDVKVHANLQVTGKVAQFGRSAMADVAGRVIDQFANNLSVLLGESGAPAAAGSANPAVGQDGSAYRSTAAPQTSNDLDAFALALPVVKRAMSSVAAFFFGVLSMWVLSRGRKAS